MEFINDTPVDIERGDVIYYSGQPGRHVGRIVRRGKTIWEDGTHPAHSAVISFVEVPETESAKEKAMLKYCEDVSDALLIELHNRIMEEAIEKL